MRIKVLSLSILILVITTISFGKEVQKLGSPKAFITSTKYDFGIVVEGVQISHDFFIKNIGDAPLYIEKVGTECGCTTVSYTKTILPNSTGKISVKVNTNGFADSKIEKNIIVTLNDIKHSPIVFTVSGRVERFAYITPKWIVLRGSLGKKLKSEVIILPKKKYPFRIVGISAKYGKDISYKIEEIHKGSPSAGYRLIVYNLRKVKGRYLDRIYLKTDSKIKPVIEIGVYGDIKEID